MIKLFLRSLTILCMLVFPILTYAALADWQINQSDSSISFTATQNDAPISGKFNNFNGNIHFDPAQLKSSNIRINVDMNSISATYDKVASTLKSADWFNVQLFPWAVFKANHFTKTGENTFQANGFLTIRNKTVPITLNFTLDEYNNDKAHVKGYALVKRTQFGVGQGEWASTDEVKDDVQVNFILSATRKK